MKTLIVIDMQNDFITGPLGTPEAQAIVPKVKEKIEEYREHGDRIIFTRDTHFKNYMDTLEGKHLPVEHCIAGDHGWQIVDDFTSYEDERADKYSFGYTEWGSAMWHIIDPCDSIELVGVCTDICVVSNALILKAEYPYIEIYVDASCCAGTTPENHKAALQVMKCCQINVVGE
jgi:nicotinamidase-related amidase